MGARLTTLTLAIAVAVTTGMLPATPPVSMAQDVAADLSATCAAPAASRAPGAERPPFLAAVPAGIAVTVLGHHRAQRLPQGTEFDLSLDRLSLPGAAKIVDRRLAGPTLFLVEQGTVAVIDGGRPRPEAGPAGFRAGESVLVELDRLVDLENTGAAPAHLLILGILPPGGLLPIGAFGAPAAIWVPILSAGEQHAHRQMASASAGALAHEETLVFAACLHWTDPAAELTPMNYPGPVGMLVLRGQALVNGTHRVGAGGCWLAPAYTPVSIRAGDGPTDIVLFGAWKASAQPHPGDAVSVEAELPACAGPAENDSQE